MRGQNEVWISGNIGAKIVVSHTKDNREACSFSIASEGSKRRTTWVRINVYDQLAEYCKDKLSKGTYCLVVGELMNREGKYGELTEIRARDVIFVSHDKGCYEESTGTEQEQEQSSAE
jgi:single-stranded DNA-binding protein